MQKEKVVEVINKTMNEGFEIPLEKLQPNSQIFQDLGLDSLDAVDMLVYLEEKLDVRVDAERFQEVRVLNDVYELVYRIIEENKTSSEDKLKDV